jgi:hypothetical protein
MSRRSITASSPSSRRSLKSTLGAPKSIRHRTYRLRELPSDFWLRPFVEGCCRNPPHRELPVRKRPDHAIGSEPEWLVAKVRLRRWRRRRSARLARCLPPILGAPPPFRSRLSPRRDRRRIFHKPPLSAQHPQNAPHRFCTIWCRTVCLEAGSGVAGSPPNG